MKKVALILLSLLILVGCKKEDERKITFIYPLAMGYTFSKSGTLLLISAVIEYSPNKDSLLIAKNDYFNDTIIPNYGLNDFYTFPISKSLHKELNVLIDNSDKYNSDYLRLRSKTIDTRGIKTILINTGSNTKRIYHNSREVPDEISKVDSILSAIIDSEHLNKTNKIISFETLKQWDDSIRNKFDVLTMPPLDLHNIDINEIFKSSINK